MSCIPAAKTPYVLLILAFLLPAMVAALPVTPALKVDPFGHRPGDTRNRRTRGG